MENEKELHSEDLNPSEQDTADQICWQNEIKEKKRKGLWWKILLAVVAFLLVAASVAAVVIWKTNVFTLSLTMNGEQEITLEYGEVFTDPGARSLFSGTILQKNPLQVQVSVENDVNVAVVGSYEVRYSAQYIADYYVVKQAHEISAKRIVHVVDTQAPQITLVTDPESYVIPGNPYVEEGFSAKDNYDGDLTDKVQSVEADGVVTYTVTDSSGNTATEKREIKYHDPIPPELTLQGHEELYIDQGTAYAEPGFTATDNCDGDITDKVTVTGTVDHNKPGIYTLEYTVEDSYQNVAKVIRKVTVVELPPMPELPSWDPQTPVTPNGKVIYLTFDDGPSKHTGRLLDILDTYGVKATFFVVNTGNMGILSRMASAGHTVAMHSASHRYESIYSSENAYFNDLHKIQTIVTEKTGITPMILRFPGGSSNTVSKQYNAGIMTRLSAQLKEKGYRIFDWNVDSRDAGGADSMESVYANVIKGCEKRNCSIVLQHDTKGFSVDAVEWIIQWGLSNGYTFLPLDATSPVCEHTINN